MHRGTRLLVRQQQAQLGLAVRQSRPCHSSSSSQASTSTSASTSTPTSNTPTASIARNSRSNPSAQLQKPSTSSIFRLEAASSCNASSAWSIARPAGFKQASIRHYHSRTSRSLHTTSSPLLKEQQQPQKDSIQSVDRDASAGVAASTNTSTDIASSPSTSSPSSSSSAFGASRPPSKNKAPESPKDISRGEIQRLFTLAKPEKKTLGIALGLLTVSSVVSLSVPFTLGRIIDLFTSSGTSNLPVSIPVAAAILASIFAIGAAANTGRSILMRIAGQRIVQRLRVTAYGNTLKLDMAKFDMMGQHTIDKEGKRISDDIPVKSEERIVTYDTTTYPPTTSSSTQATAETVPEGEGGKQISARSTQDNVETSNKRSSLSSALSLSSTSETTPDVGVKGVGDVISRLGSDASIVGESLTRELSEGLRALATVVVGVGMMVYISAKLTILMLCIVPPTAIGAVFYGRYLKKLSRRTQKKVGEMIAVAEERLSSVRTVQAFNAVEPLETKRFSKKANDILDLAKKEAYASGLFFGGAGFSGNITMLALLSYGGKLVSQGEITVGDLSSLMLYTAYVGSSLVGLTTFFSTIMKGLGAAARVFELTDARPSSVQLSVGKKLQASTAPQPIHFRNVHFSYPSRPDVPILRGVDLSIERGRSIAIAGGSGSGKSTLVNLLVRYYDPASGRIDYGDEDIRDFTPESWRERVSVVPQDPALFSQTVAENIAYGKPDATMSEIREAARLANCDFIEDLPLGFETPVGAKAAQLSGGQRQRLAIARALVRQPSILILDEATSALDAASETLVNQAVKRITSTNSLTTILIAHRLSTLKTADEIVFMQDGKVAERGTYEELAREGTEFWNMVRSQMLGTATGTNKGRESEANNKAEEREAMAV